jgi:hypothetical protein
MINPFRNPQLGSKEAPGHVNMGLAREAKTPEPSPSAKTAQVPLPTPRLIRPPRPRVGNKGVPVGINGRVSMGLAEGVNTSELAPSAEVVHTPLVTPRSIRPRVPEISKNGPLDERERSALKIKKWWCTQKPESLLCEKKQSLDERGRLRRNTGFGLSTRERRMAKIVESQEMMETWCKISLKELASTPCMKFAHSVQHRDYHGMRSRTVDTSPHPDPRLRGQSR